MPGHDTWEHGWGMNTEVLGKLLNSMMLEVFSDLNDFVIWVQTSRAQDRAELQHYAAPWDGKDPWEERRGDLHACSGTQKKI